MEINFISTFYPMFQPRFFTFFLEPDPRANRIREQHWEMGFEDEDFLFFWDYTCQSQGKFSF